MFYRITFDQIQWGSRIATNSSLTTEADCPVKAAEAILELITANNGKAGKIIEHERVDFLPESGTMACSIR
jgi:hypothetical protein